MYEKQQASEIEIIVGEEIEYLTMGFEEFAQKSLQNNRGLIKNVVHKYFRKQSSPAANEKTDLSPVRNKIALQRKAQQITDQYILFFVIVVIIVVLLAVFLGRRGF